MFIEIFDKLSGQKAGAKKLRTGILVMSFLCLDPWTLTSIGQGLRSRVVASDQDQEGRGHDVQLIQVLAPGFPRVLAVNDQLGILGI